MSRHAEVSQRMIVDFALAALRADQESAIPGPFPRTDRGASSNSMRILSGIQPSGALHIGNYFGAIRQYIDLQRGNDAYYFVADYHAAPPACETASSDCGGTPSR